MSSALVGGDMHSGVKCQRPHQQALGRSYPSIPGLFPMGQSCIPDTAGGTEPVREALAKWQVSNLRTCCAALSGSEPPLPAQPLPPLRPEGLLELGTWQKELGLAVGKTWVLVLPRLLRDLVQPI